MPMKTPLTALASSIVLLGLGGLLCACERSEPVREAPRPDPVGAAAKKALESAKAKAVVMPAAKSVDAVAPAKKIPWALPSGPLIDPEKAVSGTWIASVGDYATRSAFMADKVMLGLGDRKKGQDFIGATIKAIENDDRLATNCIWLELFTDRSGIRRGCALIKGEPSALDKTDPFTGKKSDFGTRLQWYYDLPSKQVRIRFDQDMLVPSASDGDSRNLRFRHWSLAFGSKAGKGFKMVESIPEHDYSLPAQYVYEVYPGSFLGKH